MTQGFLSHTFKRMKAFMEDVSITDEKDIVYVWNCHTQGIMISVLVGVTLLSQVNEI